MNQLPKVPLPERFFSVELTGKCRLACLMRGGMPLRIVLRVATSFIVPARPSRPGGPGSRHPERKARKAMSRFFIARLVEGAVRVFGTGCDPTIKRAQPPGAFLYNHS